MSSLAYDVEVIVQEQNPICWIASCAMVKGYGTGTSTGVGEFTGGFDPSNSCISNLAGNWQQCTDLMQQWGFDVYGVGSLSSGTMTADDLHAALEAGPCVLLHLCSGFPYGSQYAGMSFTPNDAHAVVLTGIDTDANSATFNNPWGDKDQPCDLGVLLEKINADQYLGATLGFWRG
ncbi:MAG: papain-like cysteine protease family protein [Geminicoccaceae bacterium]